MNSKIAFLIDITYLYLNQILLTAYVWISDGSGSRNWIFIILGYLESAVNCAYGKLNEPYFSNFFDNFLAYIYIWWFFQVHYAPLWKFIKYVKNISKYEEKPWSTCLVDPISPMTLPKHKTWVFDNWFITSMHATNIEWIKSIIAKRISSLGWYIICKHIHTHRKTCLLFMKEVPNYGSF